MGKLTRDLIAVHVRRRHRQKTALDVSLVVIVLSVLLYLVVSAIGGQ